MNIVQFNQLSLSEAKSAIEACVAIESWQLQLVAARPFDSAAQLLEVARGLTDHWQQAELLQALSAHPRIGEKATGSQSHATASRSEQSAVLSADSQIKQQMAEGNRAYEQRFGRIFLIRAKGRSPQDILACLEQRLNNDDTTEIQESIQQLREITLLRLQEIFS